MAKAIQQSGEIAREVFADDATRWQAVTRRDATADTRFVYAVRTTGVYCRPSCPSRRPHRGNVAFFPTPDTAQAAGYRPCRRCRPDDVREAARRDDAIVRACRLIDAAEGTPDFDRIAAAVAMSRSHFQRRFKAVTGLTPRAWASARRSERVRALLPASASVTDAMYASGFNSSGRFYESAGADLGMTPSQFRDRGRGVKIAFAVGRCTLGAILVAASAKGICAILLGDDPEALVHDLEDRFPNADLAGGDGEFERWVARVVAFVDAPRLGLDLPLDIRGTAFQRRVWQALRDVPAGSTASYADIARRIGAPTSARAVAQACAANALAVAIPCHRVVRNDGALSGYRWGIERKRALLAAEGAQLTR